MTVADGALTRILVREDGLVSFDGEHGPWVRLMSVAETRELGAIALAHRG